MLAACRSTAPSSNAPPAREPLAVSIDVAAPTVIYIARRKWHVDIGFAAADLRAPLDSLTGQLPEAKYLFFGFGDRHYLLAKEHRAPAMLGALWPGPGMLLVTGIESTPAAAFGAAEVIELKVSRADALAAQAFIWGSLAGADPATAYGPGPYEGSLYFNAAPRYSAFHTCNTWVAEALRAAHLAVRTTMVLFAGQLWEETEKLAAAHSPTASARGASLPR
jgi:Protein of unknown function (DUF2459)